MSFLVLGVQMKISKDVGENFNRMKEWISRARFFYPEARLIVFSELSLAPPPHQGFEENDSIFKEFSRIAAKEGIWLIPGTFYIKKEKSRVNRAYLFSPDGKIEGYYDKIYPWRPFEDAAQGNSVSVFHIDGVRVGIEICYDIWFPEVAVELARKGVDLILNPVMTTTADRRAERTLVQATSIFTQSYVLSVNGLGAGGIGGSLGTDPEGNILVGASQEEVILPLNVSTERLKEVREKGSFSSNKVLEELRQRRVK